MSGTVEARLTELGITLAEPTKPVAAYVAYVQTGNQLFLSGQVPLGIDPLPTGCLTKA
ncbi:MAG: RidA family protein, partial [Pseudomonadota bacterium]